MHTDTHAHNHTHIHPPIHLHTHIHLPTHAHTHTHTEGCIIHLTHPAHPNCYARWQDPSVPRGWSWPEHQLSAGPGTLSSPSGHCGKASVSGTLRCDTVKQLPLERERRWRNHDISLTTQGNNLYSLCLLWVYTMVTMPLRSLHL